MTPLRKKWLAAIVVAFVLIAAAILVAASVMSKRIEPTVREQAIQYLRKRFDSEVELGRLQVHVPSAMPFRLIFGLGRGTLAKVEGTDLSLRHHGRRDIPPLLSLKHFSFEFDLGALLDTPKTVNLVTIEDLEIQIPPPGERPGFGSQETGKDTPAAKGVSEGVVIDQVLLRNARLVILPRDKSKIPLRFDIHDLRLESAGKDVAMKYVAVLTNPKPPGEIHSTGVFGPWAAGEPGDTPLQGQYRFDNADLGIFRGIAGILHSTGNFEGTLSSINARGEATVPDFRLKSAGNPVPLYTRFEVRVDGTNGNTDLKPIVATLGSTHFTTTGFVVKHDGETRKTISLKATMPAGNLRDVLTLAMKGPPLMEGTIRLNTTIGIPPLTGKVKEKLLLDGNFEVSNGKFLQSRIQDKIDALSHRAQGKTPKEDVDAAVHRMSGDFKMAGESITFRTLAFEIPGAAVNIGGSFDTAANELDFHGALMLDAKLSETQSGWKRWLLKPVDPIFSKRGAGTFLHIKIVGSSKDPQFGLDPHGTSPAEEAEKVAAEKTKAASRQ
jgi:hypothetical protein